MKFVGATETYDPCYVKDWEKRLLECNLIITKELSDDMIEKIVDNKDKIILHHTVTGHGGTDLEPGVKTLEEEFESFRKLISRGFPIDQYVLRIDPIIPFSQELMISTIKVLNLWQSWCSDYLKGRTQLRVRISVIDIYPHIRERFSKVGIHIPFNGFQCPSDIIESIPGLLSQYISFMKFEACAEPKLTFNGSIVHNTPCVNLDDIILLNQRKFEDNIKVGSNEYQLPDKPQRSTCGCLAKKQILGVKPGQCPHKCIYCYWKS